MKLNELKKCYQTASQHASLQKKMKRDHRTIKQFIEKVVSSG